MVAEHITNLPCEKHSGRRARTQLLVAHSAETPLLPGYAVSVTKNWLNVWYDRNGELIQASINTFFGPDTTVRAVNTGCAAWHASVANSISVGYEFTGYAALTRAQWTTQHGLNMIDRAGREMAEDAKIYGIPLRWLTTDEVNLALNGDTSIKGLCTHRQIDPVNRTDPGDGFPYDLLLGSINAYAGATPAPTPTPVPEGPDVKYARLYPIKHTRTLGKNAEWFLKQNSPNFNHPTDENYACLGVGHYGIDLFVTGTGLPPGETLTVQYWLERGGKKSGYFKQEVHGSKDGVFYGVARFSTHVQGALVKASVMPSCDGVKLTSYGAEIVLSTT